jgi:crossover junction endodeoxyribonuclease RusA
MLPFEFIVVGTPISYRSANRAKVRLWRNAVRAAAARRWSAPEPLHGPLRITLLYFHEKSATRLDNDNLLKPIQDALSGLVYQDDGQITDSVVRKTRLDGRFDVRGISLILASGFSHNAAFVYTRVDDAPDHGELL